MLIIISTNELSCSQPKKRETISSLKSFWHSILFYLNDLILWTKFFRHHERSRPRQSRLTDNLHPEGSLSVSTELSSNFPPRESSRPRSAKQEYSKRRDNLKVEGQVGLGGRHNASKHKLVLLNDRLKGAWMQSRLMETWSNTREQT